MMAGKHVKDAEPRSRRSVLTGLATLGLIAATTVATERFLSNLVMSISLP